MKRFLLLLIFLQATIALGVDINGPLVRAGLENKSSDPSTTLTGRVYWNTANKKARIWDGSAWGDFGTGGGASAAYTVSPTAVTAVGTAGMPKLGHLVDANDFGGATTSQYSYWPLSANANDGNTTGARNLSPSVAISYTTTNILGTTNAAATLDGSTQYYSLANAYFNAGGNATKSFAYGGWFYKSSWSAGGKIALSVGNNTDMASRIYLTSVGGLQIDMYTSSGTNADAANPGPTNSALTAGWHHLAALYDAPNNVFYGLIDGKENYHFTPTAAVRSTTGTATFHVGRAPDLSSSFYWPGAVEDVFFIAGSYTPTVEDIRKLASRRFDHNLAIGPESQLWLVNAARSDNYVTNQDVSGALVSKDNNRAWMDFSGFATGSYVSAKMLNTQSSLTSVPQGSYDSGYLSSTPITTIPHGLGDVPAAVVVYYETTTNRFTPLMGSNFCETDATNLYCDWTGLTVAAGSRVRIQAWSTGSMSAITAASASQSGIVNTTQQSMSGLKQFLGGTSIIGNIRASEGAGTTTLTDADNRVQVFNLSAARTVVLPATSIKAGDIWVLESRGAFDLTVQASNLSALTTANLVNIDATIQSGTVRLVALQDTPTTPAHWRVLDLTEEQSFSKTTVGALTGAAVTGRLVRNNKSVTMTISGTSGTCSSSTYIGLTNVFPTRFQIGGSFNPYFPIYVQNAGAYQTTTGFIYFNGAADFQVYKDNTSAAGLFSSSGTCGWQGVSISWTTP